MMTPIYQTLKSSVKAGLQKGWDGYVWMLKIIVPISFLTFLIDTGGFIHWIDFVLTPVMGLLGLPPSAVIPLLLGLLTGIYGTLGALAAMSFSVPHMTLIAVFTLIAHNLIQEGIVQGKSGLKPIAATLTRLLAAIIMVVLLARLLGIEGVTSADGPAGPAAAQPFLFLLKKWTVDTIWLCVKIFFIIMALMVILKILKDFHLAERIAGALRPLLALLGLNERVGLIWLTACLFGLSYGAAVIVEEAREGNFTPDELVRLHLSIGINHSMIDDPILFMAFAINPFWLWIPRLAAAVVAVRVYRLIKGFKGSRIPGDK
ncbi:MAG: nucleoside recognition domain-containing protein [Thermodesulfobacteriota bacterium]